MNAPATAYDEQASRTGAEELCTHRLHGPADQCSADEVLQLLQTVPTWSTPQATRPGQRLRGATRILDWLQTWPGEGWQARWAASPADHGMEWFNLLVSEDLRCRGINIDELHAGLNWLLLGRVLRPSYEFFLHARMLFVFNHSRKIISPELFARIEQEAAASAINLEEHTKARRALIRIALHTGKDIEHLDAEDFFECRDWMLHHRAKPRGLGTAWDLLRRAGVLTVDGSLLDAVRGGQLSPSELVDFYGVRSPTVREVLIRYLEERAPSLDYSTLRGIAGHLVGKFWVEIEAHHPGIDSLDLPDEIAQAWKERLRLSCTDHGGAWSRTYRLEILTQVRAFYLDMQEWAHTDPSWVAWAVPSPVRRGETSGIVKARQQVVAQMHQRIRERLPQLPALVETAERHRDEQRAFLETAAATPDQGLFSYNGQRYRRAVAQHQPKRGRHASTAVFAENVDTGVRLDISRAEDEAFWSWAVIETLRHTGVRIEELLEITHLALSSYKLPDTGETVPLLQIVPSKSNEERVLLISPELASVLASIISRLRRDNGGSIPLTSRYDTHERVNGAPFPHLFQRRYGHRWSVMSYQTVSKLLNKTVTRTGLCDAAGEPLRYTAHDFRRIFATDAVVGGLPVHIAARLLGHHSVATTQTYLAVFQDDLIRTYRSFLDARRAVRPDTEYREPTEDEWREFQQHFSARKLELGDCGRPYGTPCQHEHACLRCPMLRVSLPQRPRLIAIIENLRERIEEAKMNGWLGEVQGLQYSLAKGQEKLGSLDKAMRNSTEGATDLGIPALRTR